MSSPDVRPGTSHCILQHSPALKSIILDLASVNAIRFLSVLKKGNFTLPTKEPSLS